MSYALGELTSWNHVASSADAVYVWRADVTPPVDVSNNKTLYAILLAAGRDIVSQYANAFVVGATVTPDGRAVDIVWRVTRGSSPMIMGGWTHTAAGVAEATVRAMRDAGYSSFDIASSDLYYIEGPQQAISSWQGKAPIWNAGSDAINELGACWAQLYRGRADLAPDNFEYPTCPKLGLGPSGDVAPPCPAPWSWRNDACFAPPWPAGTAQNLRTSGDALYGLTCGGRRGRWDPSARACRYGAAGGVGTTILGIPAWGWAVGIAAVWWGLARSPRAEEKGT